MDFLLLGPLVLREGDREVTLAGRKERLLLLDLLLHANEPVPRDRLVDDLWEEDAPATAADALYVYVSHLRGVVGREALRTHGGGYALVVEPEQVDLRRFEHRARSGREALDAARPEQAAAILREALALWRGPAFGDLADARFAQPAAAALEALRLTALEDRVDADMALGDVSRVCAELEALVGEHPLRERLWGQLMQALYAAGRQSEALEAYRRARESLVEERGLEPGPALRQLEQAILRQDPSLMPSVSAPSSRVFGARKPATPLIGRERELERLCALLRDPDVALVTLTGIGGIGKTRLAFEAAERLAADFPDGVCFVELATIADPALVLTTVAQALGIQVDGDAGLALRDHLRQLQLLLVLDNFENVLEAAPALAELLAAAPTVKMLVTSGAALRIASEHDFSLPPLELPAAGAHVDQAVLAAVPAVELFVNRARAVRDDFALSPDNAAAVAEVCRRLDGLPLAIELAAARVRLLPPAELLARLTSRLDLLTDGALDAPERQRTMRAAIDWSYRLLEADEQLLFSRLGVFVGGATLEAIEAVCDDVATLDALTSLVDKRLLGRRGDRWPRFFLLETLREYALEQSTASGEAEALRRRHTRYFLEFARGVETKLDGPEQGQLMERLEADHANLRAAIAAAVALGDGESAVGLAAALRRFWQVHGHVDEGLRSLESVADAFPDAPPLDRNKVLNGAGVLLGERGEYGASRARFEQALALAREIEDPQRTAVALSNLGSVSLLYEGDLDAAHALYTQALGIYVQLDQHVNQAVALENLGLVELARGETERAIATFERGLACAETAQAPHEAASVSIPLARARLTAGELDRPRELLTTALSTLQELGDPHKSAECMEAFANVALADGRPADAAALLGAADALRRSIGAVRHGDQRSWYETTVERVEGALGEEAYAEATARGRGLSVEQAVDLCGELST